MDCKHEYRLLEHDKDLENSEGWEYKFYCTKCLDIRKK